MGVVEIRDPTSQRVFYANTETGECTWDAPAGVAVSRPTSDEQWWELFDEQHCLPYYYNTRTGETEWLRPESGQVLPLAKIQNSPIGKRVSVALQRASVSIDSYQAPNINLARSTSHQSSSSAQNYNPRLLPISEQQQFDNSAFQQQQQKQQQHQFNVEPTFHQIQQTPQRMTKESYQQQNLQHFHEQQQQQIQQQQRFQRSNSQSQHPPQHQQQIQYDQKFQRSNSLNSIQNSPFGTTDNFRPLNNNIPPQGQVTTSTTPPQQTTPGFNQFNSPQQQLQNSNFNQQYPHQQQQQQQFGSPHQHQQFGSPNQHHQQQQQQQQFGSPHQQHQQQQFSSPNRGFNPHAQKLTPNQIGEPVLNPQAAINQNPLNSLNAGKSSMGGGIYEVKTLPKDLQANINQFRIDGFAKKYFAQHKRGIFRRTVPVEKMLMWQKDMLKVPLMVMNKELHKDGLKCFKLIQRAMGDRNNVADPIPDIQTLLNIGINNGRLRDEIYVQICKQLHKNPSNESIIRGWRLLSCVIIAFPPSKNFEDYLRNFLHTFSTQAHPHPTFSSHVIKKLDRISKTGPRGKSITPLEISIAMDAAFQSSQFNETLQSIMDEQAKRWPELKLPRILPFLAEAVLNLGGCRTEGVFRVPGDIDAVTELRCKVEKGEFDLRGISDPNVPGSLLKSWLRELEEPLIPATCYQKCVDVGQDEMAEDGPEKAKRIVDELPEVNKLVVHYMIRFLRIVGDPKNQPYTKMSVGNLAMVFAPNFLRCPSDNPVTIFENTKFEQAFLRILITSNVLG